MIKFDYTTFPALEWLTYKPGQEPESLKIAATDTHGRDWMAKSLELHTMVSLFSSDYMLAETLQEKTTNKSLKNYQPHRHLYLTTQVFRRVDADEVLRNRLFQQLRTLESGSGTILFRPYPDQPGGCYLYRIAGIEDTASMQAIGKLPSSIPVGSRWFAAAYLVGDTLVGFESGFLSPDLGITSGGYYTGGSEMGQFLSFVTIALIFFQNGLGKVQSVAPGAEGNQTSLRIEIVKP